ncbi:uncharacterized protein [Chelonus insularis]|uniref:uncharacterized protein n=1 Tax=Chelonus insularis TaxID=460826 RepID=UPI00158D2181|nr:uncharacterized protein LOC118068779 [Chelonus insularis]
MSAFCHFNYIMELTSRLDIIINTSDIDTSEYNQSAKNESVTFLKVVEFFKNFMYSRRDKISHFYKNTSIILLLFIGFSSVSSSSDVKVTVDIPKEAEIGENIDMKCNWEIYGGKSLYTVKWYKDGHEFFRYIPNNHQPIQTFSQAGVKLDTARSKENLIRVTNLTLDNAGQYKCEISTDGPAFATSFKTGNLSVISLPKRKPEITGLSSHYAVGENITGNCTAWPSEPPANIHWTINGKKVASKYTIKYPLSRLGYPANNLTILGLHLEAEAQHFVGSNSGNTVKVNCITSVGSHILEAEKNILITHVNNQRLSAGDPRNTIESVANFIRLDFISLAMIVFTMT